MMKIALYSLFSFLLFSVILIFLFSCVVTLSDAQGGIIFILSLPVMGVLLLLAWVLAVKMRRLFGINIRFEKIPQIFGALLMAFFVLLFIPGLNLLPTSLMAGVGYSFKTLTGKSPYTYFRDRKSFPNLLSKQIADPNAKEIDFGSLDVSYAWDKICIFGPYTNNKQAKDVLQIDWNIEERSVIASSDSVNALVFLYEGKVNHVEDMSRSIADFSQLDYCIDRAKAKFQLSIDASDRKIFNLLK